jgi:CubicO group peptidase (beta-lactamase class C family)
MAKARLGWLLAGWVLLASPALAGADLSAKIDSYFQPYADSGAFSGAVLVTQDGGIVFDKAYGLADAGHRLPNKTTTSFHLGSRRRSTPQPP